MPKHSHKSVRFLSKPYTEWICKTDHAASATQLLRLIENFNGSELALKPWDARCHRSESYTCWYVSFLDADTYTGENGKHKLCIVLHFDLQPKDIRVYFRFMQYAPKDRLVGFDKHKEYVLLSENRECITAALISYLKAVRADFDKGKLPNFKDFKPSSPENQKNNFAIKMQPRRQPSLDLCDSRHPLKNEMSKKEILELARVHDEKNAFWVQMENEIGESLRKTKILTMLDLEKIIEWKFESNALVRTIELRRIKKNSNEQLAIVSKEVFNLNETQDAKRIEQLCTLSGVGTAVASVLLAFYDPENYCVIDFHVFQEVFGHRPKGPTISEYLMLLDRIREEAREHGLTTRIVEKAYFTRNLGAKGPCHYPKWLCSAGAPKNFTR
ncbi:MAG: hypothetical protein NWE99_00160 [Candidatus Bathyarchaeota archaeon]|nr:hypothetical protein [Candidatus Bathyarchaeota archaeon]